MVHTIAGYEEGEFWKGLGFGIEGKRRPSLCIETIGDGKFRLAVDGQPVLWAQIGELYFWVDVLHDQGFRPCLDPFPAAESRRIDKFNPVEWYARWSYEILNRLKASVCSPLHDGDWVMRPARVSAVGRCLTGGDELSRMDPVDVDYHDCHRGVGLAEIDCDFQPPVILPLRPLNDPDFSRVKAFRKQAKEGLLPPVVLFGVGGLCGYVIIDGHDRFAAFLAEGITPACLAIEQVESQKSQAVLDLVGQCEQQLEDFVKSQPSNRELHEAAARRYLYCAAKHNETKTTAWVRPELIDQWPKELMVQA